MTEKLSRWRALAEKELKADPDKLAWHTPEGIDVKALYTPDDLEGLALGNDHRQRHGGMGRQQQCCGQPGKKVFFHGHFIHSGSRPRAWR